MQRHPARFLITYTIGSRSYQITMPGISASHVRAAWDRPDGEAFRYITNPTKI